MMPASSTELTISELVLAMFCFSSSFSCHNDLKAMAKVGGNATPSDLAASLYTSVVPS